MGVSAREGDGRLYGYAELGKRRRMAARTTALMAGGWELGKRRRMAARTTALLAGSWVRGGGWLHARLRCWLGAG